MKLPETASELLYDHFFSMFVSFKVGITVGVNTRTPNNTGVPILGCDLIYVC